MNLGESTTLIAVARNADEPSDVTNGETSAAEGSAADQAATPADSAE
jgi:DNA gyrase subunit A